MNFNQEVYKIVSQVPKGKVATYGQIASILGSPRAARQVGWALHSLPMDSDVPWQRIINRHGMISTTCEEHTPNLQKQLLNKEGVKTTEKDGLTFVGLDKYLWKS
jgi:methylated-DNA-protein-cysteine methyltransferase related protein